MGLAKIMGQVGLDGSAFSLGAKQVESEAQRLSNSINSSLKGQLAGILGVAFFEQAIQRTIQWGAQISDLAKRAGVTAEAFQKMSFAFGGGENVTAALEKLNENRALALQGGTGSAQSLAFGKLGISQAELHSNTGEVLMRKIGDAVKAGNVQELAEPLKQTLGKGFGELVPGFKKGMDEMGEAARQAGAIASNEQIASLEAVNKEWKLLTTSLMVSFIPVIQAIIRGIEGLKEAVMDFDAFVVGFVESIIHPFDPEKAGKDRIAAYDAKREAAVGAAGAALGAYNANPSAANQTALDAAQKEAMAANITAASVREQEANASKERNKLGLSSFIPRPVMEGIRLAQSESEIQRQEREARKTIASIPDITPNFTAAAESGKTTTRAETSYEKMSLHVDSLAKMGGFVGGAGGDAIVTIAKQQLDVTRHMAGGVETITKYVQGKLQSTSTSHTEGDANGA